MVDSINLGIHVVGDQQDNKPTTYQVNNKCPDRKFLANHLKTLGLAVAIESLLLRKLNDYPDGALQKFWDNLPNMIRSMRQNSKE